MAAVTRVGRSLRPHATPLAEGTRCYGSRPLAWRTATAAAATPAACDTSPWYADAQANTPRRAFSTGKRALNADDKRSQGLFSSLLHGSESAREDGMTSTGQSHSNTVGRGKYIHEIQRHVVRPDKLDEYKSLLAAHYPRIADDDKYPVRLVGSFEVQVGEMETFCG